MRNFMGSSQPGDDNIDIDPETTIEVHSNHIAEDVTDSEDKLANAYVRFFGDSVVAESTYL